MMPHARFLFFKAAGSLQPGERWITINAGTPQSQPVLLHPEKDGSYRVIGGAGGSLNYLKLTPKAPGESYAKEAAQTAQRKRDEKKRQGERDRAAGTAGSKAVIAEGLKAQLGDQRVKLVQTVAQALGWKDSDLRFPEETVANLPESARKAAETKHAAAIMKKVGEAVDFQRQRMLRDGELRQQAGLGEVPLTTAKPDDLSVQDLNPIEPATKGFGFAPDYAARSGVTKQQVKAEAEGVKPPKAGAKRDMGEAVAKELEGIREPAPPLDPKVMLEARQAVDVLKAAKEFSMVRKQVRAKTKELAGATTVEPARAYVLDVVEKPTDADIGADLSSDLKTLQTRAFLEQYGAIADGTPLGRHLGVGAFNSVNALALAAGGAALVDRSVVDVLGPSGAAQVLAARLRHDLTAQELDDVTEAMSKFHGDHYMQLSEDALREAREWQDLAHEIELGEASNGADLATAQELNAKRRDAISKAQRTMGTALGEMETNAALVLALQQPAKDLEVSLGSASVETAITQLRAIGLTKADYEIEPVDKSLIVTVRKAGLAKLAQPVARADLEQRRESQAIVNGDRDEDDWLPQGVSDRPDLAMNAEPGVAPRLAKPFNPALEPGQGIADYIGGRTADGDTPADIMAGLLSQEVLGKVDHDAFMAALNEIAPLHDEAGNAVRVEKYTQRFNKMADRFVEKTYGADRTPLQKQNFKVDATSMDALHRALTEHPEGVAAFKPVGDLTAQDEGALRKVFEREYGRSDPAAEKLRTAVDTLDQQEPAKESEGLFGMDANPDWARWKGERDAAAEAFNASAMTWDKYVGVHGSPQAAYAALSDVVRGNVLASFGKTYNTLNAKKPLILGKQAIAGDLAHLKALDPAERTKREAERSRLVATARNRVRGQFSEGGVGEKLARMEEAEAGQEQAQMGLFGVSDEPAKVTAPKLGERTSLGQEAERQIAGMMSVVGKNFRPGQSAKVFRPTWSGKYVARQRAVKLLEQNKRVQLALGTGAGKTSIMLASFADLKSKGKAKRGLFAVPSVVQGEFGGTALQILEPGKFQWHAEPGAPREARIAAYKDPSKDFSVVTHAALRDDFDTLLAADGLTPSKFDGMAPAARQETAKRLLGAAGWNWDFLAVDEGHNLLNRQGKANSHLANVADAVSGGTEYYANATADPVKNDVSEAFDLLRKLHPDKYQDRAAFMRRYGPDTDAAKQGLKQELTGSVYAQTIDPGVALQRKTIDVPISAESGQHTAIAAIDAAADAAKLAHMAGKTDIAALKTLAPYAFQGVDPAHEQAVADKLQAGLPMIHQLAVEHAVSDGAKTEALTKLAEERKGKPGVVFAHRLDRVSDIAKALRKAGHRVQTLTGADSSKVKDARKRAFQAGEHDILICSDAGAVGSNLQRGQWLVNYDTPQTAMVHAQRNGRIHRMGQKNAVELLDLVADHPSEKRARERLEKKYQLRELMTSPSAAVDETGLAYYLAQQQANKLAGKQASKGGLDLGDGVGPVTGNALAK